MKAVAVNGSPRKGGNTEIILGKVLEPLAGAGWDVEMVQVGGRNIRGCLACYQCFKNKDGHCVQKKDIFNGVLDALVAADAIILGSPTYVSDVTPEIKALMDRCALVSMANGRLFLGKIGAGVVAVRRAGATHVLDTMNHLFLASGMVVPGSTYWNIGYGLNEGEVRDDAEGMANMRHLGQAIDWLGRSIAPNLNAYPQPEPLDISLKDPAEAQARA